MGVRFFFRRLFLEGFCFSGNVRVCFFFSGIALLKLIAFFYNCFFFLGGEELCFPGFLFFRDLLFPKKRYFQVFSFPKSDFLLNFFFPLPPH